MIRHTEISIEKGLTFVERYVNNTRDSRHRVPSMVSAVHLAARWGDSDVFLRVNGEYVR